MALYSIFNIIMITFYIRLLFNIILGEAARNQVGKGRMGSALRSVFIISNRKISN